MADATDSKSVARKGVWVQVPPPVLSVLWLAMCHRFVTAALIPNYQQPATSGSMDFAIRIRRAVSESGFRRGRP